MYLYLEKFVSGYAFSKDPGFDTITEALGVKDLPSPDSPSLTVRICVAYWRKANAIHNWFVNHVQDGVDDCREYYVDREDLVNLRQEALEALGAYEMGDTKKAEEILPPAAGFFFGGTQINVDYAADLKDAIEQIDKLLALPEKYPSFIYRSSW